MHAMPFVHSGLALLHALAGAACLGAMVYSFFILHPRARAFFPREAEFEAFIATVSRGTRYPVLTALALVGASGAALSVVRWPGTPAVTWVALIGLKTGLFAAAVGLFVHVSWRLWPARILALPEEVAGLQTRFRHRAAVMLVIASLGMALGVLTHTA
jgi:hypothetical protein